MNDWNPFEGLDFHKGSTKKTPYQFDLEIKDRKPGIVPKVGDKVKIKSREWYEKWKDEDGSVTGLGTHLLTPTMSEQCGAIFEISSNFGTCFTLKGVEKGWTLAMFEEVYPKLPQIDGKNRITSSISDELSATAWRFPYPSSPQGVGIVSGWSNGTNIVVNANQSCFCGTSFIHQNLFEKKEPELQTIKKHRFIKLENL